MNRIDRTIVDVIEAAKHYIDGKKVRRYITPTMYDEFKKQSKAKGERYNPINSWENVWIWLDTKGVRCSNNSNQSISYAEWKLLPDSDCVTRVLSPSESIDKFGSQLELNKQWEVQL